MWKPSMDLVNEGHLLKIWGLMNHSHEKMVRRIFYSNNFVDIFY